jgi:hypothetical protein
MNMDVSVQGPVQIRRKNLGVVEDFAYTKPKLGGKLSIV